MADDPRTVAKLFFNEVVNGDNLDLIDELVAPDFVEHEEFPGISQNREGVKQFFAMFRSAFPDMKFSVEDMIAEGEKVVVRSKLSGTHKGEFMGIPPTGKSIDVSVIDIVRITSGQAVDHWGITDTGTMMQQLGVA